jgi:hypothetical protein
MSSNDFLLCEHVYLCVAGDFVVVLDLKQDKYLALPAASTRSLSALVPGWPIGGSPDETGTDSTAHLLAGQLVSRGILCTERDTGKSAQPVEYAVPQQDLMNEGARSPPLRIRSIACFAAAWLTLSVMRQRRPLIHLITRIRRRRSQTCRRLEDLESLRDLVCTFDRLRPFAFGQNDACLFDSLVLLEFLAWHGYYPDCVFGVRAKPFKAHCWLQQEGTVVNDTVEHVASMTPIMVI